MFHVKIEEPNSCDVHKMDAIYYMIYDHDLPQMIYHSQSEYPYGFKKKETHNHSHNNSNVQNSYHENYQIKIRALYRRTTHHSLENLCEKKNLNSYSSKAQLLYLFVVIICFSFFGVVFFFFICISRHQTQQS